MRRDGCYSQAKAEGFEHGGERFHLWIALRRKRAVERGGVQLGLLREFRNAAKGLSDAAQSDHHFLLIAIFQNRAQVFSRTLWISTKLLNGGLFMASRGACECA